MNFNFNNLSSTSFTNENTHKYLKPYDIYPVNLTKIEKGELKGKDGQSVYPIVTVEFKGDDGIFSQNIFIPNKEEDFIRGENSISHKLMASRFDQFQFTLMQIVEAINPEGAAKIKENGSKLKTIDDFISVIIKALNGKENVKVYLKLVGQNSNGTTYARLPNACFIGQDGNPVPSNFISAKEDNLYFSNYEIGQRNNYINAKPSNMDTADNDIDSTEDNSEIDDLLSGLE